MFYIICIATISLLCAVTNSQYCKRVEDKVTSGISKTFIQILADDINNVTANKDVYITNLREKLKKESLPPDTVKYYLFTPDHPKEAYVLTKNKSSFEDVPYDKNKPLALGIHGFTKQLNLVNGLIGEFVQAIVGLNKYNVIFVDYSTLTEDVFSVVLPRAYLAAKDIVEFLKVVTEVTGTKPDKMHVIGFSLGGQMSGIIGNRLPGIGRITALDPLGTFVYSLPKDLRLDRSDANFVDVMHTASAYPFPKGWGYFHPCGHLDMYPNGGKFQPGCGSTIPIEDMPTTDMEHGARACMHKRFLVYYVESMCTDCTFIGTLCDSFEKYENGLCPFGKTAIMGEFATKPVPDLPENAMFFLETEDSYPFCKRRSLIPKFVFKLLVAPLRFFVWILNLIFG